MVNKLVENNLKNKYIAITGSTGGLGEQLSFHLAELGANFIFLNRNLEKSKILENKLKIKFPNIKINHIQVDMEDINSIKNAIIKLNNIDILILNAGTYKIPRKNINGIDNIFLINFLSQFYLTTKCLKLNPKLKVVAVGSIAHKNLTLNEKDIQLLSCNKDVKLYGNAKRFLIFTLTEMLNRGELENLSIVHPGITFTNITSHYPKVLLPFIKFFMNIIFPSTKKASLNIVKGVIENTDYKTWIGPKILDIWGKPTHKQLKTFSQKEAIKMLELSENLLNKLNKQD